jgi:hypothetical protein
MRNDVVIVTAMDRDELLCLCLEAIRREDETIPAEVFSDRDHWSGDAQKVCLKFGALAVQRWNHSFYGNSWNLMKACEYILESCPAAEVVHLIEDDTIIHKGYLSWARQQLSTGRFAAVCGRIGSGHIENWYESPCASWNAECLRHALTHIVPGYFSPSREEMQRVLDEEMFPNSKYKRGGAEQDGFFLRCIEHHGWKTLFPPVPLATHAGWWGYNSPPGRERPTGTFQERVAQCRAMLTNRERRKELFGHRITDAEMSGWDGKTI